MKASLLLPADSSQRSRAQIEASGAALQLPLTATQIDRLLDYLGLLARWNETYNLTAIRDADQMVVHHLADCMACIAPLRRELSGHATGSLLDVGSGAGLPGLVIAAVCPEIAVTCIDTVGKKAAFIAHAAASLRLKNLSAHHGRVEQATGQFEVITSRAFSSLAKFVSATSHMAKSGGKWMAMKGRTPTHEIAELSESVIVFHVEPIVVPSLNAERCLVWMRCIEKASAN